MAFQELRMDSLDRKSERVSSILKRRKFMSSQVVMTNYTHQTAPTRFAEANGIRFAYRRFGKAAGVPIVFNQHYIGTMDYWDPAVTDGLARLLDRRHGRAGNHAAGARPRPQADPSGHRSARRSGDGLADPGSTAD